MPTETPLLSTRAVEARYGRMQVLWGVDIDIQPGETILLLGANGAGKTTFLKTLVGLLPASAGVISFAGEDIAHLRADKRMRRGIAYMSELGVFPDLTIEENIRIGAQALSTRAARDKAEDMYALFPVLKEKRSGLASSLSGGQRKMLGIAKALAADPRLLVMDEPSAGLSPLFVGEVVRTLGALRGRGLAMLIAEQNIGFLGIATRVYVLEGGRIGFSGTVAAMEGDEALRKAYFGLK
ncbi:MAG: ABC transporter ATP-binding protein [Hyphomicrobiales bacterium]|nr:ABC transporter ATP-binding protein [Hyphomicrobiales bacterium]